MTIINVKHTFSTLHLPFIWPIRHGCHEYLSFSFQGCRFSAVTGVSWYFPQPLLHTMCSFKSCLNGTPMIPFANSVYWINSICWHFDLLAILKWCICMMLFENRIILFWTHILSEKGILNGVKKGELIDDMTWETALAAAFLNWQTLFCQRLDASVINALECGKSIELSLNPWTINLNFIEIQIQFKVNQQICRCSQFKRYSDHEFVGGCPYVPLKHSSRHLSHLLLSLSLSLWR